MDILINNRKPKYDQKKVSFISRKLNDNQKEGVIDSIKADDFHLLVKTNEYAKLKNILGKEGFVI